MTVYLRVQWRRQARRPESTIAAHRFDPVRHLALQKPATDRSGKPLPVKYRTNLAGAPVPRSNRPVPDADQALESGHLADHEGES